MKLEAGIPIDVCTEYKRRKKAYINKRVSSDDEEDCIIELQNVEYSYVNGNDCYHALQDVNARIYKGQIVAVVGQTGSGKSTLLQMINKLIVPQSGHVHLYGVDVQSVKNTKEIRRKIGYVFQFPESQLFESTVIKDVMYGPLNFGMEKDDAERAARCALELVGVQDKYEDYSPFELSGGLKKRVAMAGILAYSPDILILDEPACGLDGESREQLWNIIRNLNREKNVTVILVSHDMEDVYEMSERVLLMDQGRIVYDGDTDAFFEDETLMGRYGIDVPDGARLLKSEQSNKNRSDCK